MLLGLPKSFPMPSMDSDLMVETQYGAGDRDADQPSFKSQETDAILCEQGLHQMKVQQPK